MTPQGLHSKGVTKQKQCFAIWQKKKTDVVTKTLHYINLNTALLGGYRAMLYSLHKQKQRRTKKS